MKCQLWKKDCLIEEQDQATFLLLGKKSKTQQLSFLISAMIRYATLVFSSVSLAQIYSKMKFPNANTFPENIFLKYINHDHSKIKRITNDLDNHKY